MKTNVKQISLLLGLCISAVFLWLFLREIEWDELYSALQRADYIYVIPAVLITLVTYLIRTARWELLVLPIKKVSFPNVLSATTIGLMANHVLPARAGEIIRCVVLSRSEKVRVTGIFATVIMERLLDSLSLIIFATVVIAVIAPHGTGSGATESSVAAGNSIDTHTLLFVQLKKGLGILTGICIMSAILLAFLDIYTQRTLDLVSKLCFFLPHSINDIILHLLESFVRGLKVLKNFRQLLWLSFLSFSLWISFVLIMILLGYSFGIDIPFAAMCFVCICIALAVAMPQAPGYIGVFHYVVQKSLELFHVAPATAQSYAIVLWSVSIFTSIILGAFFLWREGLSFGQMVKAREVPGERNNANAR
ncbi:MAG: lysylphosphatidylglycerol synthase transmembrane domain-containing protein [Candidatus Bathyanammoxibius sp.]